MSLTFSDGMTFNTSGPYRVVRRRDGWYVVGQGMLMPVTDQEDGQQVIVELRKTEESK